MHSVDIFRGNDLFVSVKPDDSSSQTKAIMGENTVNLQFTLSYFANFKIGDWCTVFNETYKLNSPAVVEKQASNDYRYTLKFSGESSDLAKVQYLFLGSDNTLRESDFSLTGNAASFVQLLLKNLLRIFPDWQIGQVIPTDYKTISFSKENCFNALSKIADQFSTEFWIKDKTIHLTKYSKDKGTTLKLGKRKGLYDITRNILNNADVITRLYAYGSDKNLPSSYSIYSNRLRLPGGYGLVTNVTCFIGLRFDNLQEFVFSWTAPNIPNVSGIQVEWRKTGSTDEWSKTIVKKEGPATIQTNVGSYDFVFRTLPDGIATNVLTASQTFDDPVFISQPIPYIEKNTDKYGIIEYTEIFDDIYPRRTGKVTSVDAADYFKFIDSTIDFDINNQYLPGLVGKVVFNTGQLAGFQFEINRFDFSTKEITILKNKDETKMDVPSELLRPAIGDEYVLVDINMPAAYIQKAEAELMAKAQTLLDQISSPQYNYTIQTDPVFLKTNKITFDIGDLIWIVDGNLELDNKIRISQVTRNLVNEYDYSLQLSDTVDPGTINTIINNQQVTAQSVNDLAYQVQNNKILNGIVVGNLVFDQGTAVMKDIPKTSDISGFAPVYLKLSTGELYIRL